MLLRFVHLCPFSFVTCCLAQEAKEGRKRRVYAGVDVPGHSAEVMAC